MATVTGSTLIQQFSFSGRKSESWAFPGHQEFDTVNSLLGETHAQGHLPCVQCCAQTERIEMDLVNVADARRKGGWVIPGSKAGPGKAGSESATELARWHSCSCTPPKSRRLASTFMFDSGHWPLGVAIGVTAASVPLDAKMDSTGFTWSVHQLLKYRLGWVHWLVKPRSHDYRLVTSRARKVTATLFLASIGGRLQKH